jgi:nucleotide-binding universal stress UspA family protein
MAEIINFRKARKTKLKAAKEATASENRVRFGRPKAERLASEAEETRASRALEGHRRNDPEAG